MRWRSWIFAALASVLFALTYYPYAFSLFNAWQREEYSHGILIPILALLLCLNILSEKKPPISRTTSGIFLIILAYAFIALSELSAFEPPAHYGLIIFITGLVLTFLGGYATFLLLPALIYLLFAIPLPRLIEVSLTAELQLLSSTLGVVLLQSIGIPVFQDGNIIDLGVEKIHVVEACSGLRYLFPLMSFSYLLAFIFQGKLWKRCVIFLSAIPLTLLMNALRIALTGILVNKWGGQMAEGVLHDFEGVIIFAFCIFALLNVAWVLTKIGSDNNYLKLEYIGLPKGISTNSFEKLSVKAPMIVTILCFLMTSIFYFLDLRNRPEIIPQRQSFYTFPLTISNWRGRLESFEPDIIKALGFTDYLSVYYKTETDEPPINLYMAYYQSQRLGNAAHSPANCIPGGGWKVEEKSIITLDLKNLSLPVTRMVIKKGTESMLVYYWFNQRGRILNEQFQTKWYLFLDSIILHRTDGAVVRVMTQVDHLAKEGQADEQLKTFLNETYAQISSHLPQ